MFSCCYINNGLSSCTTRLFSVKKNLGEGTNYWSLPGRYCRLRSVLEDANSSSNVGPLETSVVQQSLTECSQAYKTKFCKGTTDPYKCCPYDKARNVKELLVAVSMGFPPYTIQCEHKSSWK